MREEYIIRNTEDNKVLSKISSTFTDKEEHFLLVTKEHAEWFVKEFDKEKSYKVKYEKYIK